MRYMTKIHQFSWLVNEKGEKPQSPTNKKSLNLIDTGLSLYNSMLYQLTGVHNDNANNNYKCVFHNFQILKKPSKNLGRLLKLFLSFSIAFPIVSSQL